MIPFLYLYVFNREQIFILCGILSIGFLGVDLIRFKFIKLRRLFLKVFGSLLKGEEQDRKLTGATHLFLSATIVICLFNRDSVIPALIILSISDACAAVFGTIYGQHRLFNKSLEGSLVFFFVSFFIIIVFSDLRIVVGLLISGLLTLIEVLPIPVNDNYSIAICGAFIFNMVL